MAGGRTVGTAKIKVEADASELSDELLRKISSTLSRIENIFAQAFTAAEEDVQNSTTSMADDMDKVGESAEKAAEKADDIGEKAKEGSDKASRATAKTGSGFDKAAQKAGQLGSAGARIGDGAARGAATGARAAQSLGREFTVTSGKVSTLNIAGQKIGDAFTRASMAATGALSRIATAASNAASRAQSAMVSAATKIQQSLQTAFKKGAESAGSIPPAVRGIATAVAAAAGPVTMLKAGFDRLVTIDKAKIMFKNLGLSSEQIKAQMSSINDIITDTNMSMSQAAQAASMLMQAGVEAGKPLDDSLKALTNMAAIAPEAADDLGLVMMQIKASGRLMANDAMSLSSHGISIYGYLAESLGKSYEEVRKMGEDGQITYEMVVDAINAKTGDLAKELGQTLPNQWANFKTAIARTGAAIIEPFMGPMSTALGVITDGIDAVTQGAQKFFEWLNNGTAPANTLKVILEGLALALTAVSIVAGGAWIAGFISNLFRMSGAIKAIGIAWQIATGPIGWIIIGIGLLVAAFIHFWQTSEGFRNFWIGLWEHIKSAAQNAWQVIVDIWNGFWDFISPLVEAMKSQWQQLWGTIGPVFQSLWEKITAIKDAIADFITNHWAQIKPILIALGLVLISPIIAVLGILIGVIAAVIGIVTAVIYVLNRFIDVIKAIPGWVSGVVDAVKKWFSDMWRSVTDSFHRTGDAVTGWWDNNIRPLPGRVGSAIRAAVDWFLGLPGRIRSALAGAGSWLLQSGRDIVQGLINGVKGMAERAVQAVRDVGSRISDGFKSVLGIHSPSRVFTGFGENIGQGLIQGVRAMRSQVIAETQGLADAAANVTMPTITPATVPTDTMSKAIAALTPTVAPPPTINPSALIAGPGQDGTDPAADYQDMADTMATVEASVLAPMQKHARDDMNATASTITGLATGVIAPAWKNMAVGLAVTTAGVIDPMQAGIRANMSATSGHIAASITRDVLPQWRFMASTMAAVKVGGVDPVFAGIRGGLNYLTVAFANAVASIRAQWAQMREATAAPVRFTINTVFNHGLVGMWNSVSDLIGTKRMAPYVARFATGGYVSGPGGPKDDKIPALLSNGEYVVDAENVRRVGVRYLDAINTGSIPDTTMLDPDAADDMTFRRVAARFAGGGIVKGSPAWNALRRGWLWAKSRSGRPYVWGGSADGAGGSDCSGFMSGIADVILGGSGARQWATGNFPGTQRGAWGQGLAAGFSVGIRNGGPGGGHTAGTIGGVEGIPAVNVESGGSPSRVKFGAGAVGATDSYFNQHWHLRTIDGGRFVPGTGSGVSIADMIQQELAPHARRLHALMNSYRGRGGTIDQLPRQVGSSMEKAAKATIDKKAEEMSALSGDPGGAGVERWTPLVTSLLRLYGHPMSWLGVTMRRMQQESGGNPRAVNNWDINAKNGDPSKGLMQVIGSTFRAYRDPRFPSDIFDPRANVAASMRYTMSRYGNLPAGYGRAGGYHQGGVLGDGPGLFHKTAFAPERVLSPSQTAAFDALVDSLVATPEGVQAGNVILTRDGSIRLVDRDTRGGYRAGDTTHHRTVLVTQHIHGGDPHEVADEVEDRLTSLTM